MIVDYITSLVDYPERVCTTLFTYGCNLRCPYCYNHRLFEAKKGSIFEPENLLEILLERKKLTKYICITGGEPTVHKGLANFIDVLDHLGFKIKLDTNGTNPEMLKKCLPYLSYCSMDIKATIQDYKDKLHADPFSILGTIRLLNDSDVDYEYRTVLFPPLVNMSTIKEIGKLLIGKPKVIRLSQFNPDDCYMVWARDVEPYTIEMTQALKLKLLEMGIKNIVI